MTDTRESRVGILSEIGETRYATLPRANVSSLHFSSRLVSTQSPRILTIHSMDTLLKSHGQHHPRGDDHHVITLQHGHDGDGDGDDVLPTDVCSRTIDTILWVHHTIRYHTIRYHTWQDNTCNVKIIHVWVQV